MKKWKVYLLVIGSSLGVIFLLLLWLAFGPSRPLMISKMTTHLTEPLTADGYVDYVAAIRQRQGPRIPPEQNKAVVILQATWPAELSPEHQQLVCDALQIQLPTDSGWRSLDDWTFQTEVREWLSRDSIDGDVNRNSVDPDEALRAAAHSPWRREQFSLLSDWLDSQQHQLDQLHQVGERPGFYSPSTKLLDPKNVSWFDDTDVVALMSQDASRSLKVRAMRSIGQQQPQLAWRDIQTIYQLSDARPTAPSYIELLVSIALRDRAYEATWTLLNSRQCDAQLLTEIETFLAAQKSIHEVSNLTDQYSRFIVLDGGQRICRGDESVKQDLYDGSVPPAFDLLTSAPFDRNAMMATLNDWCDRDAAAARLNNPLDAYQASARSADETKAAFEQHVQPLNLLSTTINQRARGKLLGNIVAQLGNSFTYHLLAGEFRCNTDLHLVRAGVLLEKYRLQHGQYPESLDSIADDKNRPLLTDPFTGKLLQYSRRESGFLLYSCFLNGIDNGGDNTDGSIIDGQRVADRYEWYDRQYDECDLVVLLPPKEFELPQPGLFEETPSGE